MFRKFSCDLTEHTLIRNCEQKSMLRALLVNTFFFSKMASGWMTSAIVLPVIQEPCWVIRVILSWSSDAICCHGTWSTLVQVMIWSVHGNGLKRPILWCVVDRPSTNLSSQI